MNFKIIVYLTSILDAFQSTVFNFLCRVKVSKYRKQSMQQLKHDKLWQNLALGTILTTSKKCYKLASTSEILQGCHIQMPWAFVVPEWMRSRNFSASLLVNYTVPLRLIFSNKWRVVIIVEEPKFQAFIKCVKNYNHVLIVRELICKPVFQISIWNEKLKYEIKEVQKAHDPFVCLLI